MINDEWCSPWWLERIAALEAAFSDGVPDGFLSLPEVQACGLTTNDVHAAEKKIDDMAECGVDWGSMPSSVTDLAHLYHLWRAGVLRHSVKPRTIIEFGGGTGNTAALSYGFDPKHAHIVIDVPVMLRMQAHHLRKEGVATDQWLSLGREGLGKLGPPREGAVTLVPWAMADLLFDSLDHSPLPDVFLGTFSVSECTEACHDWLIGYEWFGASTVLLAMEKTSQLFPDGAPLYERLSSDPQWSEATTHHEGSVYLKRER